MEKKRKYVFFWLTGNVEILEGTSPSNALNEAGYSMGAVRALDFYSSNENDVKNYIWDSPMHKWKRKQKGNNIMKNDPTAEEAIS